MCHLAESVRSFAGLKDFASGKQVSVHFMTVDCKYILVMSLPQMPLVIN